MLYLEAVEPHTLELLRRIMDDSYLKNFYLVGGTALALHYGHRVSEDIDLFSEQDYELVVLKDYLQRKFNADIYFETSIGIRCMIENIKTDFLNYPYPSLEDTLNIDNIRVLNIPDIAAMKLAAINSRGAKRDFYDVFFLLKHNSLEQLVEFFSRKYKITSLFSLYMSLTYFNDADGDVPPVLLKEKELTWAQVKKFIEQKVHEVVK